MNYETVNHHMYRRDSKGESELMANFSAKITHETHYITTGRLRETVLTIEGTQSDPEHPLDHEKYLTLPTLKVDASEFASMSWVLPRWGVQCVVRPGQGIKDDLRTAIQINSKPEIKTIYRHIGWTEIGGKRAYLHARGAIGRNGNNPKVEVQLPQELSRYDLTNSGDVKSGIGATLELLRLTKPEITWPLLAATILPIFGPVDFALHVTGKTGTFKSEMVSLFQSHYGVEMDGRHLPGSWSSTANALEAQAFHAANAPFVIDDFVPAGTAWQVRAYQTTADKIIRSQGNQSGRARLTDTSALQETMYPRGIIISTGEDTPEGHSIRARLLILEMTPGDIQPAALTKAQANRPRYTATIAALVQFLADTPIDLMPRAEAIRNEILNIGHTRTPAMLGRLIACAEAFIAWAASETGMKSPVEKKYMAEARAAITKAGNEQHHYLESADPCDLFTAAIRHVIAAGLGHFRTIGGGIPLQATTLGWTAEQGQGELPTYKSHGPTIGWINWDKDELYLDLAAGYNIVRKVAGSEVAISKQTLIKRLKDAGCVARADENRQRNTVRITAEGHPRQVIALILSTTLETHEVPQDD